MTTQSTELRTPSSYPFRSEQAKAEYTRVYEEWAKRWPVPFETRLIDTPSAQTFVRISGRPTDPPLVLLSGARGTSLMWAPNIAALSAHYRTYALDTITDVGLSVARGKVSKPEDFVRWLDEVFSVLVPEGRLSLMGISYGGWLTSQYALRCPDRLEKAVIMAPACTVLRLSLSFFARVVLVCLPLPGSDGTALRRMLHWVFEDTVRSGEAGRKLVDEVLEEIMTSQRFFTLGRPPWPTVLTDEEWRTFKAPALFLVGANEKIYSPQAAIRRLNRLAPWIKTGIIPGAGHDMTLVQADLVSEKVLEFLGEPVAHPVGV